MARLKRIQVVKDYPESIPELIQFGRVIIGRMGPPNTWLSSPPIPYATVSTHLDELVSAETAARSGTHGMVALRDVARAQVIDDLDRLHEYTQGVVNANMAQASLIIASSGWKERKARPAPNNTFRARMGKLPGQVLLNTKAAAKSGVSYEWEVSPDGGETWILIGITTSAGAVLGNLTPGKTYLFRYRIWIDQVAHDWSQIIHFIVY